MARRRGEGGESPDAERLRVKLAIERVHALGRQHPVREAHVELVCLVAVGRRRRRRARRGALRELPFQPQVPEEDHGGRRYRPGALPGEPPHARHLHLGRAGSG